jgi:hypothetical protein
MVINENESNFIDFLVIEGYEFYNKLISFFWATFTRGASMETIGPISQRRGGVFLL